MQPEKSCLFSHAVHWGGLELCVLLLPLFSLRGYDLHRPVASFTPVAHFCAPRRISTISGCMDPIRHGTMRNCGPELRVFFPAFQSITNFIYAHLGLECMLITLPNCWTLRVRFSPIEFSPETSSWIPV